jgi:flagellar hook-length control protein FliK
MINLSCRWQSLVLAMLLAACVFSSATANADIYKWTDARGVTQYSTSRDVPNATKASQNEIVNALQFKDICTGSNAKTNITQINNTKKSTSPSLLARFVTTLSNIN